MFIASKRAGFLVDNLRVMTYHCFQYSGAGLYVISDTCNGCGECASTCPIDVITPSGGVYVIGLGCNQCGVCGGACNLGAIRKI